MSSDFTKLSKGITIGTLSSDPVDGVNGDIYYNTTSNKFRKFEAGIWTDLDTVSPPTSLNLAEFKLGIKNWTVPLGVEQVLILAVGGGGGGGGGKSGWGATGPSETVSAGAGGTGGAGAVPMMFRQNVVPGDTLTITVGAGGTGGSFGGNNANGGTGGAGGNTLISGIGIDIKVPGAPGGIGATSSSSSIAPVTVVDNDNYAPYSVISTKGGDGGPANAGPSGSPGNPNAYYKTTSIPGGRAVNWGGGHGAGGGGGAGGNSLGIGGSGAHGVASANGIASETITTVTRVNGVTTFTLGGLGTANLNVGELVRVFNLEASFNGFHTVVATPTANQISILNPGNNAQAKAKFVGQVAGMTTDVTIEALTAGVTGNTIVLTFDGVSTINQIITAWNLIQPASLDVVLVSGDGTQIPDNGETMSLSGAVDQAGNWTPARISDKARSIAFVDGMDSRVVIEAITAGIGGNSISFSFDGSTSINDAISNWNIANPSNTAQLVLGDGTQIPDNLTSITLSGGGSTTIPSGASGTAGTGTISLVGFGAGGGGGGGGAGGGGPGWTANGGGGPGQGGYVAIIY